MNYRTDVTDVLPLFAVIHLFDVQVLDGFQWGDCQFVHGIKMSLERLLIYVDDYWRSLGKH